MLRAGSKGIVSDINIAAVARAARLAAVVDRASPQLLTYVGHRVNPDTPLMAVPQSMRATLIQHRLVTIKAGRESQLAQAAQRLHGEAMSSIRDGSIREFESSVDAWRETLVEFATAWKKYNLEFSIELTSAFMPFRHRASI